MTVLVVEDDSVILEGLRFALTQEGYQVMTAASAAEAMEVIEGGDSIGFYLLDVMLPDGDGYQICRAVRQISQAPILFLTACDDEVNTVMALEQGADDYIAKPFNPLEAVARINSNIRRFYSLGANDSQTVKRLLKVKDLTLDLDGCILRKGEEVIELSSTEYRLMELFMGNPGKIFTKQQIYEYGWQEAYFIADNNIMVCISKLRAKLSQEDSNRYIRTVRGLGYRFEEG